MKPAPPETTARGFAESLFAANSSIRKTVATHDGRIVNVAPVDHDRLPHGALEAAQVEIAKLVPLCDHDDRIGAGGRLVSAIHVLDFRQDAARSLHRRGAISPHRLACRQEDLGDLDAWRLSKVVRVRLESQAEKPDHSPRQHLETFPQLVDDEHALVTVDGHDRVKKLWVIVEPLGEGRQRLDIFGKARAAVPDARVEEAWADPLVEPHPFRDELRVSADPLADSRNLVDE